MIEQWQARRQQRKLRATALELERKKAEKLVVLRRLLAALQQKERK